MTLDRFVYGENLKRASGYREWRSAFWPPADDYRLFCLDLASEIPSLGPRWVAELDTLRAAIETEWERCKSLGVRGAARMHHAASIARSMHRIADLLPSASDRRALRLRADSVERGYDDATLSALGEIDEEITVVAGKISTWYGKHAPGLPTAFGCVRDRDRQSPVAAATQHLGDVGAYLRSIHAHLRLGEVPVFAVTRLFFMAGEGNRHPKHIAYFLPEDEGIKRSPFKRTCYFVNTHGALMNAISLPLARRLLDVGSPIAASAADLDPIPTLGVWAHEIGHFIHREPESFAALNSADYWASATLQETAADVFGTLVLAEVLAPALGLTPADVVTYHLAECLRYVDRGLGCFPDSDGMYLQLNYLVSLGALTLDSGAPSLVGDPEVVIAAFRSIARVLADTLLAADVNRSLELYQAYGPAAGDKLSPLIATLREGPQKTIEYLQEPCVAQGAMLGITGASTWLESSPDEPQATVSVKDPIRDFYCRPRKTSTGGPARNIYEIWERGEAFDDSVTPSTYCSEYREHMVLKILSLSQRDDKVFSIGCGNSFVEAGLLAKGLHVQAIDCNPEAVELATAKGVEAFTASYAALPPGHLASFGIVYADGLLGHLYRPETGLDSFFEALIELKPRPGGWLVLSNDAPPQSRSAEAPRGSPSGFWHFSQDYLSEAVARFGFAISESYHFPYERPLSGLRNRAICIARVAGSGVATE